MCLSQSQATTHRQEKHAGQWGYTCCSRKGKTWGTSLNPLKANPAQQEEMGKHKL